jgi:hypothetical protein
MSSRRSRSRASSGGASRISDEQISDLVAKLQALLPEARLRSNDRVRNPAHSEQSTMVVVSW